MKTGGKTSMMGAFTSAAPEHNLAYNPTAFLPLPHAMILWGRATPPSGIPPRATIPIQAPHPFPTYTAGSTAANTTEHFAPQNVL